MRLAYTCLLILCLPLVFLHLWLRGLRDARYRQDWGQRLWGRAPVRAGSIIVHAASLGEVNAAAPLLEALLKAYPEGALHLSTFTPVGAARGAALFGERVSQARAPLDLPWAVRRFLGVKPALLIIMETEIWPNLLAEARRQRIPVLLANARMSERSWRRYLRFSALSRPALADIDQVLAQTRLDAERYRDCGAREASICVTGNLKFDLSLPEGLAAEGARLRSAWGVTRPVLVAGSTHAGDESVLLEAFTGVLHQHPEALLVLVPRHPERFAEAAATAARTGLRTGRHSQGSGPDTQCLVVDAMGILPACYAAADLCFVGGTLAPIGGHNLLEPAALGKPVLFGPHLANVSEVSAALLQAGGGRMVCDANNLSSAWQELLRDAQARQTMATAALGVVTAGRGALARTLTIAQALLAGTTRESR